MAAVTFPNYTQIPSRIPVKVWHAMRAASLVGGLVVAALLIAAPKTGLYIMWRVVIPSLPLLFMVAPGLWRNLCPLAASNQQPRALNISKALTAPDWLKEYGYVIAFSGFALFIVLRKFGLDSNGAYSALLLLGAMTAAFAGGMFFKGKSGWCSTMCPLLPVQRIYGQTPLFMVANAHCQPCVGCVKNCYDFNPRAAYLADLHDSDNYWSGYRRFFVGALPGLVLAFFQGPHTPDLATLAARATFAPPPLGAFPGLVLAFFEVPNPKDVHLLAEMALYAAVSLAAFSLLNAFVKTSTHTITSVFGATAFGIFYWFVGASYGPPGLDWVLRAA